jgi:hypothetical protein
LFALEKSHVYRGAPVNAKAVSASSQKLMRLGSFELLVPKRALQATSILQNEASVLRTERSSVVLIVSFRQLINLLKVVVVSLRV